MGIIWQYFNFTNQLVSALALWCGAAFLMRRKRPHWIAVVPACFMTTAVTTYACRSKEFGTSKIPFGVSVCVGTLVALAVNVGMYLHINGAVAGSVITDAEARGAHQSFSSRRSS